MIFAGIGAKLAASAVGKTLGSVPRWVWIAGAAAALLALGQCKHRGAVKDHYAEAFAAGKAAEEKRWQGAFAKMREASEQWRMNYDHTSTLLSQKIGELDAQELRRSAALADDLRLHGPGQAAAVGCGPQPGPSVSTRPRGPESPTRPADAPLAPVPADQPLAIVPWGDLVRRSEDADADAIEVDSWRSWYREQKALHEKLKLTLPEVAFGN